MINKRLLKELKSGRISKIPLPEGYFLTTNEFKQVYITQGGKKRYYLLDAFIYKALCDKEIKSEIKGKVTLIKNIVELEDIAKHLRKDSKVRAKLEQVVKELNNLV